MKIAVRYYTKTGNTKRLAEAVAKAVGTEALPISVPVEEPVDVLFLGNSYYALSIDPEVRDFIRSLDNGKIGRIISELPFNDPERGRLRDRKTAVDQRKTGQEKYIYLPFPFLIRLIFGIHAKDSHLTVF